MQIKALLATVTASLASAACTNGAWQCSGQSLQQCSYDSTGQLNWITNTVCGTGLACSAGTGNVWGCVAGVPPVSTTTTSAAVATKTKTTIATTAAQQTTTTGVQQKTTTTTAAQQVTTTTAASGGSVPTPPLPAVKKIIYIDNTGGALTPAQLAVPGYANNDYNIINIGFWLDAGAWDSMVSWTGYDAATRQSYVDAYHKAGKLVLVSAFGAAEWPTLSGQDPIKSAQNLAAFVKQYQLDGADIDWEDNNSVQAGTGEAWLIKFTTELRNQLPRPYVISHAPQAPYFINNKAIYPNGAYLAVDKAVGSLIDYYNIQFYNQGSNTRYDTCQTLLNQSGGDWPGTSLFEIAASGVPLNKLVIGKPITAAGAANTGYTDPATLASCVAQAKAKGWDAGVFGWQYNLDPTGNWIHQVGAAL